MDGKAPNPHPQKCLLVEKESRSYTSHIYASLDTSLAPCCLQPTLLRVPSLLEKILQRQHFYRWFPQWH